jgi:Ca2+-binding EF-hand superfamily protein
MYIIRNVFTQYLHVLVSSIIYFLQAVDDDKSGKITAKELRQALLNSNWSHFNAETCRLLIGMFDSNRDGTIEINEFAALWKYVQEWRNCFDR